MLPRFWNLGPFQKPFLVFVRLLGPLKPFCFFFGYLLFSKEPSSQCSDSVFRIRRFHFSDMGALAPTAPWIPEDDVLLKNAVEVAPFVFPFASSFLVHFGYISSPIEYLGIFYLFNCCKMNCFLTNHECGMSPVAVSSISAL